MMSRFPFEIALSFLKATVVCDVVTIEYIMNELKTFYGATSEEVQYTPAAIRQRVAQPRIWQQCLPRSRYASSLYCGCQDF